MNTNADARGFNTVAIRAGQQRTFEGEHNDPIFMTSSFVFASAAEAAARFSDEAPGNVYSRFTNPTVRAFETRLAALENAQYCQAAASGMAAVLVTCMVMLKAGDHVVASRSLFGATIGLFNKIMSKFGVSTTFVPLDSLAAWDAAVTPKTKLFFAESPSNPLGEVVDLRALAQLAHDRGCRVVIDNVACTPALQQPLALGADVVVHSTTKYIDGQGRAIGGAIATND
ncbi:MAG: aminotransferase class V-fold PLP-dependent enzyme, partial [Chromatiales bacterium]|nr:aminotransferase class V-fold PLP-dependent enzyme [Chromatiales bacterium]